MGLVLQFRRNMLPVINLADRMFLALVTLGQNLPLGLKELRLIKTLEPLPELFVKETMPGFLVLGQDKNGSRLRLLRLLLS